MDPVNERRLRPVYDFIDAANYKKALQEVEKVLKKQKEFQCAKVLKALALLRLGREPECQVLLEEVHKQSPTDDATLQAMTICYREMGKPELVTLMYEKAVAREPANEELASHLFMSYVRTGDVKKQQLVAMSLYKIKPKNPYYFWSVMSLYLQAISESDEVKRKLLLTLAEKKVDKMVIDKKIEAEAEVELLLMILEREEKYEQMIHVMEGPLGARFLPNHIDFVNRRKAFLYLKMGNTRRAFDAFKCLLDTNPDQMEYFRNYISAAFTLDDEDAHKKHTGNVIEFIKKLTEKSTRKSRLRGPHLAKIELYFMLIEKEEADSGFKDMKAILFKKPTDGFLELFSYFGHKNPFYSDVCYIYSKYKSRSHAIISQLPHLFSSQASYSSHPADLDQMKWCSVVHYLEELSGTCQPDNQTISKLLSLYLDCLRLGEGLLPSEINPSDDFSLLAAHILSDKKADEQKLMLAIVILEKGIERSPANHTMKLLLIMLYNSLGCVSLSHKLFQSLETKYIQVDTLQYVIHSSLVGCGDYAAALTLFSYATKFYLSSCKDTNDFTISCYKYGSFTKIEEITQMKHDLRNSFQFLCLTIDRAFLQIIVNASEATTEVVKCVKDAKVDSMHDFTVDNRDIRVFSNTPLAVQEKLEAWKQWSLTCDKSWYRFRALSLKAVIITHDLLVESDADVIGVINGPVSSLESVLDQMRVLTEVPEAHQTLKDQTIIGPHTPRVVSFLSNELNFKQIIALLETVRLFSDRSKENTFTFNCTMAQLFDESVTHVLRLESNSLLDVKSFLETLTHQTETLSLTCLMLSFISFNLKKSTTVSNRKGKKKEEDPINESPETIASFNDLLNQLSATCQRLTSGLGPIKVSTLPDPLVNFVVESEAWNAEEWKAAQVRIQDDMINSYNNCSVSLRVAIKKKLDFLSSLTA